MTSSACPSSDASEPSPYVVTISRAREAPLMLADGSECWVTVHPSFLLRIPEEERRREERARFVEDLVRIRERAAALA